MQPRYAAPVKPGNSLSAPVGVQVKKQLKLGWAHFLLMLGSLVMILPFIWMISTSFKTFQETLVNPPIWIPSSLQWHNYLDAWHSNPYFGNYFFNSFYTTLVTVVIEVILSVFAAYAFSRMRFLGKNLLFVILLSTMMVPGEVLLVPNFITIARLHWYNKYPSLIVPFVVSVFAVFLLRQHFLQIPNELQDAAYLDGAGHTRFLLQIMLPLSRPPIATIALLKFVSSWNAFLWPLIVTNSPQMRTVSVGLNFLMQEEGPHYQVWMAAATLALVPVVAVFLSAQRQFLESVAKSGLKG